MEFTDLDKCMYPELAKEAVRLGLVGGYPDGTLRPQEPITREQSWLIDLRQMKFLQAAPDVPAMVQKYMPSIVRIWSRNDKGQTIVGSGSFITPDKILTNAHVVGVYTEVEVDTQTGTIKGTVIKKDIGLDLALVQVKGKYTPLILANKAVHGELCLVLGNPGGEWQSVTMGLVAHPDRGQYIETDARINPGNSGGAVINMQGQLIGVPSHKITLDGFDNQNYCIRVEVVRQWLG
jgi:S1-C subfamily serine protease